MQTAPSSVRSTIRLAALLVSLAVVVGAAVALEHVQYGGTLTGYENSTHDAEVLLSIPSYRDWGAVFSQALADSLHHPTNGHSRMRVVAQWMMVIDFAYLLYFLAVGFRVGSNRLGKRLVLACAAALVCSLPTAFPVPPHAVVDEVFLMPWYHSGLAVHLLTVVRVLVGLHVVQEHADSGVTVVVVGSIWSVTMITLALRLCYSVSILVAFFIAYAVHRLAPDAVRREARYRLYRAAKTDIPGVVQLAPGLEYSRTAHTLTSGTEHGNVATNYRAEGGGASADTAPRGTDGGSAGSSSSSQAGVGLGAPPTMETPADL